MKKMQKTVSILLSVIMLFSLFTIFPIAVNAEGQEEGMSYIQRSWNGTKIMYKEMFCKDYKILDENTDVNLTEGWYVLTKSISLNKRLMINSGTVNLILCDDAELKTIRGIGVSERATLNIYAQWEGTGAITFNDKYTYEKLQEIYPEYFNNAIIGGTNGASGTINIYGGTLTLKDPTEYLKGAAIGGGYLGSTGGITIYGGTIDVKSAYGAAIGGGDVSPTSRVSGKGLIIYGGFITAESKYGAGIGCGYGNNGKSGFIAIYKGKIQAKSKNGAAIGGGYKGSRTGKIDIYGGIIDAYSSEYGAGIGSGENADQIDEINIHGGNVYARAVRGAGIGSGACGDSYKINITGGKVTAHSYSGGAGIGAGMRSLKGVGGKQYGGNANEINISDAVVEAKAFNKEVDNKFLNGMNRLSESVSKAIKDVDMDFSSIPAATLSAIEFGFKIIANLADDDGECYGAGIGAGSRGGVVSINIKNSTVTANGGLQSAGIGSSKQGGIKSINIINSTVESHGDDLGAGIGTGNQGIGTGGIRIENSKIKAFGGKNAAAIGTGNETTDSSISIVIIRCNEVKATGGECGAGIGSGNKANGVKNVYISESTVEANGGEEGAGIGTGNESKTRTSKIEINYYSNITANGGEYAAGIGGGDDVSCGEVWIHGSTVKAYGGKDAAGIGGGEDGHGGQVYIGGSDVYAKGKHYGAGIGGGEDGDGGYCEISSTAKVKAIAGSDGWGIAIGNGDFTTSRKAGTVKLADNLKVKIKKTVYTGDKRVPEMRVSKNVVIYPCDHTKTEWKFYDAVYHIKTCKTCGEKMNDEKERHEWNRDNVCTVCGAKANFVTVTLVETDSTGNTKITKNVLPDEWEYEMPEATNVPKGKEFVCWRPRGESDCKAAGQVIEAKERTYDAVYLNVEDASFIDEEGVERTVSARVLDQGFEGIVIPDGWYVFKGVYYANERIYLKGEVHLILEDDCLYSGTRYNGTSIMIDDVGKPELSLYGQRKQTGTIDLAGKQICVSSASVYGGIVRSTDNSFGGEHHTNIIRGTLDIWRFRYSQYGVVIKGGNIKTYENDSTLDIKPWLEMGWTNPSDSISLKGFRDKPIDGAVKVTDGQAFIDEDGNIYSGFLTGDQAYGSCGQDTDPLYGKP